MIAADKITIKTLIDNTAAVSNIMAEWGLSIHLDLDGLQILLDTGTGNPGVLRHNMEIMGVKAAEIDYLVLSHAHQDHTGGLRSFFSQLATKAPGKEVEVISHPQAMQPTYTQGKGSFGCPYTVEELFRLGARFNFSKAPTWLTDDIVISGEVPLTNDFETVGDRFYRQLRAGEKSKQIVSEAKLGFPSQGKSFVVNELEDDQAIFIRSELGLIVILGCAHRGMINTVTYAQEVTGVKEVHLVIGGTHLVGASPERMEKTVAAIKDLQIKKVGVSHCTGLVSGQILASRLGRSVFFNNNAGSVLRFSQGEIKFREF